MEVRRRNGSSMVLRAWMLGALVLTLAACSAPNLDETVVGQPAGSIRESIVDHGKWDETLTDEQLDQLAGFIAEYAGANDLEQAATAPGWSIWKANECGSCHALAAGESGN